MTTAKTRRIDVDSIVTVNGTQYERITVNPRYVRVGDRYTVSYRRPYLMPETLRVEVTEVTKRDANYWEKKDSGNVIYRIRHETDKTVNPYKPWWYFAFVEYGSKETIEVDRPLPDKYTTFTLYPEKSDTSHLSS